jgi:hypothetical protein
MKGTKYAVHDIVVFFIFPSCNFPTLLKWVLCYKLEILYQKTVREYHSFGCCMKLLNFTK